MAWPPSSTLSYREKTSSSTTSCSNLCKMTMPIQHARRNAGPANRRTLLASHPRPQHGTGSFESALKSVAGKFGVNPAETERSGPGLEPGHHHVKKRRRVLKTPPLRSAIERSYYRAIRELQKLQRLQAERGVSRRSTPTRNSFCSAKSSKQHRIRSVPQKTPALFSPPREQDRIAAPGNAEFRSVGKNGAPAPLTLQQLFESEKQGSRNGQKPKNLFSVNSVLSVFQLFSSAAPPERLSDNIVVNDYYLTVAGKIQSDSGRAGDQASIERSGIEHSSTRCPDAVSPNSSSHRGCRRPQYNVLRILAVPDEGICCKKSEQADHYAIRM